MRFIVYGAGAVGGTIGARLFQSGHEVVLIARGAHLEAIRAYGLTFVDPKETVCLPISAAGHPSEIEFRDDDAVLLTMKTQDTVPALEALRAAAKGKDIAVVCIQNGVENERLALRRFRKVYATIVMLPATHLEPGIVESNAAPSSGVLDTGNYPSGADETAAAIADAFNKSRFDARPNPAVMRLKYGKLIENLGNAVQAAVGQRGDTGDINKAAREEAVACYRAAGIDFAAEDEMRKRREGIYRVVEIAGRRRAGGSSWQSLARGTGSIETDYLNGEIVLLGALHGIPTPVNRALQRIAAELVASGAAAASMDVAEFRRRVLA